AHVLEERHSARLLDDHSGEGVVGVAVLPTRTRLEVEWLLRPRIGDRLRRRRDQHPRHYIVLRPEVLVAGRVGEEHSDGYIVSAREAGDVFRDRIVESELPFLLEEQRCDGGELFADR